MRCLLVASLLATAAWAGPAEIPSCRGEKIAVLPLLPVATVPAVAKFEEERLRAELSATTNLCVMSRAETLTKLSGASAVSCDDANCRHRLADRVGADWVIWGTVFGFGARTSVSAVLWDNSGERLSRRSYEPNDKTRITEGLLSGARALPIAGVPSRAPVRGRGVPLALAGTGIVALAAGTAFGMASLENSRQITERDTGCAGIGSAYVSCIDVKARSGQRQASYANVLFGAAAVLAIGAGVTWVMSWP